MTPKEAPSKENAVRTLKIFWNYSWKYPKPLLVGLILIPVQITLLSTVVPLLISKVVDILAQPQSTQSLTPYMIAIITCTLIGATANYIGFGSLFKHMTKSYRSISQLSFRVLSERGETFFANKFTGALTKYAIDYPSAHTSLESTIVINVIPFFIRIATGLIAIWIGGAPLLSLFLLIFTVFTVSMSLLNRRKRQKIRDERRIAQTNMNSHLADFITNNQTVRSFAQWDNERQYNKKLSDSWAKKMDLDFLTVNRLTNNIIQASLVMQTIFIFVMIYLVRNGGLSIGIAIFSTAYIARYGGELLGLGNIMNQVENALSNAAPMTNIIDESTEVNDIEGAEELTVSKGSIEFDAVKFSYQDNADQIILSQLSLNIKPGERIGLVGPSGGGKSTVTKLLLRLLDIQSGTISIDGKDISRVTQESLRKNIAYVPQESILFHRSLIENIRYGKPNATKSEVIAAAKKAHAHDFITILPEGYDTMVGERGVKLSGGQRQRVAIARAILKDAPILILDEATSALDSESEKLIQDALKKLMQNKTSVVIAHRLSTVQKLDRIIVLENGVITEEGSHGDLIDTKGTYAKLWSHQSGGFLED